MIDVVCEPCGGRVLIGTRQMISMRRTDAGIEVGYVCHCGRVGMRLSGRAAAGAQRSPAAAMSSSPPSTTNEEPVT